jgi:hypothetical protein
MSSAAKGAIQYGRAAAKKFDNFSGEHRRVICATEDGTVDAG